MSHASTLGLQTFKAKKPESLSMKIKSSHLIAATVCAVLAGCGGGDVNLGVETTDNSVSNGGTGGGTGANPCAQYTTAANEVRQGTYDGTNCTYSASFVGVTNPLTLNLTIPYIEGVHIFEDSLFVGADVTTGTAPAAGTGPTLTIAAGNTLAFSDQADYVAINRGATIVAQGTAARPITFTGYTDAVTGTAGPEDVQLWGGVMINGNGITNNCTDAQRTSNQCHVTSEGQPLHYGGNDNAESSGVLRYVVIKHPGFEVANGNELNGLTLNAVGSGTTIENLQIYSTYDDGVEFFGGAVNISNYVALYVRDDSIDFSDGWSGTIDNALVIHARLDSNHCIEGDSIGSGRTGNGEPYTTAPISEPTIRNLTCITSQSPTGTHGPSRGAIIRQGAHVHLEDSVFFGGYGQIANPGTVAGTQCWQFRSDGSDTATPDAAAGLSTMDGTILACAIPTSGNIAAGVATSEWVRGTAPYTFNTENLIVTTPNGPTVSILEPNSFYTSTTMNDGAAAIPALSGAGRRYGAVTRAADWTAQWTYGLHASNRGQPLWFE
jgi:hypothetical protein